MSFLAKLFVAALLLTAYSTVQSAESSSAAASRASLAFDQQFGDEFFDAYWQLNPGYALSVGYYKYADRLIVPDDKSRTVEIEFIDRWLGRLHTIDPQSLTDAQRADWAILDNELAGQRWQISELREWQWNPSAYNVADPFAKLLNTEFAPLDERLRLFSRRLQHVPAYYAAARRNLNNPTLEHTQLAIEQNQGALASVRRGTAKEHRVIFPQCFGARTTRATRRCGEDSHRSLCVRAADARALAEGQRRKVVPHWPRALRQEILLQHSNRRHRPDAV